MASRVEWERLQAEEESREARERALERRTLRRTRALVAVLAVAAVVAAGLTFLAFNERSRAEREARTAVARALAAASVANLDVDPERSVLLAIEAIEETRSADGSVLPEAEEALHRAVTASRIELSIQGAGGTVDWGSEGIFVTEETDETGVIDIRDASTGETVRSWKGHGVDVNDVAFSPDGSMLATTGDDEKLKLWDPTTGRLFKEWTGEGDVWGPSFSADGSLLSAAWAAEGVVRVVDPDRGRALTKIQMEGVRDTGLSPDGSRVAASSPNLPDATVFDVDSGKRLFDLSGHAFSVLEVAWSPNGRFIATGGIDGTARVFEARTGEARFTLTGHKGNVWDVDWSGDSKRLVTGAEEGTAIVWEIAPGGSSELFRLSGQGTSSGASVALSPDGERVVTGSGDFLTTQIWDLGRSGDAEWANFPVEELWDGDVAFMPDNRRLMATRTLTEITLWDTKTGGRLGSTKAPPDDVPGKEWFQEFDLSPDGAMVASAGVDGNGQVWDPVTGEPHFTVDHRAVPHETSGSPFDPSMLMSANWSAEGGHLVTASRGASVKVTDRSGHHIRTWRFPDDFYVPDAALSHDGRLVAISSLPGLRQDQEGRSRVTVREMETGDVVTTIRTQALEVAFDPTGTKIATADEFDGIARIWDAKSGKRLLDLAGHSGSIVDIEFSPDGKVLATGGFDGTARLFDVAKGVQRLVLRGHRHAVYGLAFSPDGTKLATESADGTARVWALDLDDLLEIARDQVTRSLTEEECRQYLRLPRCP